MRYEAIERVPPFPAEEIPFILGAVLRCSVALRKKHATEYENTISNRLRKLMIRDPELRQRPVELEREALVYDDDGDEEDPVGRLDFRFLFATGSRKPRPYFAIEAKRLHVAFPSRWDPCIPEYVTGSQGMMCFIGQRYAQGLASGGMLGYVFDGDIEKARTSIAASIEKNRKKLKTVPPFKLVPSSVLPGDSRVTETVHSLAHGKFVIYHLFVAVLDG